MVRKNDDSVKTSPIAAERTNQKMHYIWCNALSYTDNNLSLTGIYPGLNSAAINLGGRSQMPAPESVIQALNGINGA